MTRFYLKGIPTKRRPRFTRTGRVYVDQRTAKEEAAIREAYRGPYHTGPVGVEIDVYPRLATGTPKSVSSKPMTQKPDADNIAKVVLDGLQGKAFGDDKQVTRVTVTKHDKRRIPSDYTVVTVYETREI